MHDTWNDKYIPDINCYWDCGYKIKGLDDNFSEYYKHQITKHFDEWHAAYNNSIPNEEQMWENLQGVEWFQKGYDRYGYIHPDRNTGNYRFYDKDEWRHQFESDPEGFKSSYGEKGTKEPKSKKAKRKLM
tara:strand:+ start:142 stop:531 length:390 start_codon:yes stop_codon:yes gene_type:complete